MTITEVRPPSFAELTASTEPEAAKSGVPAAQIAIVAGIVLLTVAYIPGFSSSTWVPKEAVLAVLAAAGLPVLLTLSIGRGIVSRQTRLAARMASLFVFFGLVSALFSKAPGIALVGLYQQGTGWVFIAGVAGCWALSTRLGEKARELFQTLIVFAAIANAVVAIVQLTGKLNNLGLPLYSGVLPDGLQSNPFELGALMTGVLALVETRFRGNPRKWYLPIAIIMVADGASGERLPQLLVFAVLARAAWHVLGPHATRSAREIKRLVALGVLSIGGLVVGYLAYSWSTATAAFQRVTTSTSQETFGQRFTAWHEGLRSFSHNFLIGAGPGQFRAATSSLFPLSFMKLAPDMVFTDAHNFIVEYLTTTGILGAGALLVWLGVILYRARGPFAAAALVMLVVELAEPLNVGVFPVAFALLACSTPLFSPKTESADALQPAEVPTRLPTTARVLVGVFAIVGVVAATCFVVGDGLDLRASQQFGLLQDKAALSNAGIANVLLAPWPDPASNLGQTHFYLSLGDHPSERPQAVYWAEVAVSRDPTNPSLLVALASYEMDAGQYRAAQQSAAEAAKYLPWFPSALNLAGVASLALGEHSQAHRWFGLSLEVEPSQVSIRNFYDGRCGVETHQIGLSLLNRVCAKA